MIRRNGFRASDGSLSEAIAAARESESSKSSGDDAPAAAQPHRLDDADQARPPLAEGNLLKVNNVKVLFDGFKALDIDSFELGPFRIARHHRAQRRRQDDAVRRDQRQDPAHRRQRHFRRTPTSPACRNAEIARRGVGRKFQTPTVFNSLTVYQNMELALPGRQGAATLLRDVGNCRGNAKRYSASCAASAWPSTPIGKCNISATASGNGWKSAC